MTDLMQLQGWGKSEDRDLMAFWSKSLKDRYNGSEGERRLWLITVTIMERDTLRHRLRDVKCPVWILHGDQDAAIPVSSAQEQAEWFVNVNPADLRLNIIPGGSHYLTQSKPDECRSQILDLLQTYVSRR